MTIPFYKYQGTGNDFIIIDREENPSLTLSEEQVKFLCDRHFGIGADGLMLYEPAHGYDFGMRYYNSDGKESTMCGNGGRCMAAFWRSKGNKAEKVAFLGIDGSHTAEFIGNYIIRLGMNHVTDIQETRYGYTMNTGSPHLVKFVDTDLRDMDVRKEGRSLRNAREFEPEGINVNFVQMGNGRIYMRTYERGVENETLSCGTGTVAVAIAVCLKTGSSASDYEILSPGGMLRIHFDKAGQSLFHNIVLEGPADFVFRGEISILNT